MRNSVTAWFEKDEVPTIDFEDDNDMVNIYLGKNLEFWLHKDEAKHLANRILSFLKEKENATSTR